MGAGASAGGHITGQESSDEIAEYVGGIGTAYVDYKKLIAENGISGEVLLDLTDKADFMNMFRELGIVNNAHLTVLWSNLGKRLPLQNEGFSPVNVQRGNGNNKPVQSWSIPNVSVPDCVGTSPRVLMKALFALQGIPVDPSDIDPAVYKLANFIGSGFGDGVEKYDCFINYRVRADADVAEKLYLSLKTMGIHPFLDKKCLRNGEDWKTGFLKGLCNSHCFVAVISSKGLENVRDCLTDKTHDNVLLEYEAALKIQQIWENPRYICPLLVGDVSFGVLKKFQDFDAELYSDRIESDWEGLSFDSFISHLEAFDSSYVISEELNIIRTITRLSAQSSSEKKYFSSLAETAKFWSVLQQLIGSDVSDNYGAKLEMLTELLNDGSEMRNVFCAKYNIGEWIVKLLNAPATDALLAEQVAAFLSSFIRNPGGVLTYPKCSHCGGEVVAGRRPNNWCDICRSSGNVAYICPNHSYDLCSACYVSKTTENRICTSAVNSFKPQDLAPALVSILSSCSENASVTANCLDIVGEICGMNADANAPFKTKFVEAGVIPLIVKALQSHPTNSKVAAGGMLAIGHISSYCPNHKNKFDSVGGVEAVIFVLKGHALTDSRIAHDAVYAMQCMSSESPICVKAGNLGVCELILDVLRKFGPTNTNLVEVGLEALKRLAANSENKAKLRAYGSVW